MNKTELIKELRNLTQAGMKDCKDALEETNFDLQKAVDVIKVKGLNIVSSREGKVAAEGMVAVSAIDRGFAMVEINCQTDFVANSADFKEFAKLVADSIAMATKAGQSFTTDLVESARAVLVAKTKENVVIRRWWVEEASAPNAMVTNYVHSNAKIGVLLTLLTSNPNVLNSKGLATVADDLAMQVAAMSPIAVSSDRLDADVVTRQKAIFETQLTEANKPSVAWPKILEGKFNKWNSEVCLLDQESVVVPKNTIRQVIKNLESTLGEIQIVNFIRCQVGEGLEKKQENFAEEVAKLM